MNASSRGDRKHVAIHPHARDAADGNGESRLDLEAFLERFGVQMLAVARRHSNNAADADDAFQRAMEVLLTKAPDLRGDELAAWASTVVRNEALQIHRRRRHLVDAEFEEIADRWVSDAPPPEEMLLDTERLGHGREALSRIHPDQARCLLLRADGLGYPEICELTGFSYAKVNRLLSEGRKAFHLHVGMIDSGLECERLAPVLSMVADGEPAPNRAELDRHLETCVHCRSTLRDYRESARDVGALLPLGASGLLDAQNHGLLGRAGQALRAPIDWLQARLAGPASELHQGAEIALGKKIALVAGVCASLVAGGAVVEHAVDDGGDSATPAAIEPPKGSATAPAQTDRARHKRAALRRTRKQRAAARQRQRQLEAASAVEAAAASTAADAATPLSGVDQPAAADPADSDTSGPLVDGQGEGLAP